MMVLRRHSFRMKKQLCRFLLLAWRRKRTLYIGMIVSGLYVIASSSGLFVDHVYRPFAPTEYEIQQLFECQLPASAEQINLSAEKRLPMCDCFPSSLHSYKPFYDTLAAKERVTLDLLNQKYESMTEGHWSPRDCVARQQVAVIVPYSNRERHLLKLLNALPRLLQKQNIDFTLIVSEQGSPRTFNKAKLMNAAYVEAKKLANFSCYFFHDVDLIPEDERILHTCPSTVRYQGTAIDIYDYKKIWDNFIGGVSAFTPQVYEAIDGHSNLFWGWGGEDDNIYHRLVKKGIKITTVPRNLAKYHMVKHTRDRSNPVSPQRWKLLDSLQDGLSTLNYKLVSLEKRKIYVWMLFDISQ